MPQPCSRRSPHHASRLGFVETAIVGILLLAASWGLAPGVDENVAATVAILDRVISYWSLIITGIVLYLITRKR